MNLSNPVVKKKMQQPKKASSVHDRMHDIQEFWRRHDAVVTAVHYFGWREKKIRDIIQSLEENAILLNMSTLRVLVIVGGYGLENWISLMTRLVAEVVYGLCWRSLHHCLLLHCLIELYSLPTPIRQLMPILWLHLLGVCIHRLVGIDNEMRWGKEGYNQTSGYYSG